MLNTLNNQKYQLFFILLYLDNFIFNIYDLKVTLYFLSFLPTLLHFNTKYLNEM